MEDEWKIPAAEGYMLLGQIAEARCTQVVNPKYTYICKVDKSLLARYFWMNGASSARLMPHGRP